MPTTLAKYILREVAWPTVLALCTLCLVIFTTVKVPGNRDEHLILLLMRLLLRDDLDRANVILLFFTVLPTLIMFIMPMALLMGIIIGVGRMTLDLEVRAMEAGGVGLVRVFAPVLMLAALLSASTALMAYAPEPLLVRGSIIRVSKLLVSEFSNLEPGRIYDELFSGRSGMNFTFESRGAESARMEGVTVIVDRRSFESEEDEKARKAEHRKQMREMENKRLEGKVTEAEVERFEYELKLQEKNESPIMIFAREAAFGIDIERSLVELNLYDGSIHIIDSPPEQAPPDPEALASEGGNATDGAAAKPPIRDYALLQFGKFSKREAIGGADLKRNRRVQTIPDLARQYRDTDEKDKYRNRALGTILERFSQSFACLVMAIIGIPVAVWVRPTGKSIGVVLAFALILVYHWLMRSGFTLVESGNSFGPFMIFFPNLLFAAIGAVLWWRVILR